MFKKEDNFKYFLGGTAVGVTAGLVIGKLLLPNVTAGDIVKSESGFHTKQNQSGYLRDDNALYPGKQPIYHPRSKSASRYEDMKFDNASTFIKPLQKNVESSTTFNNFVLSSKSKINQDKALRGNKECSNYMGATNKTDIAGKEFSYYPTILVDVTKDDNNEDLMTEKTLYKHIPSISNLHQGNASENYINNLSKIKIKNVEKEINTERMNIIEKNTQLFDNTQRNTHNDGAETSSDIKVETFMTIPYTDNFAPHCDTAKINSVSYEFQTLYDDMSNIATCNTIMGTEIEDTFNESNLISSTRYDS